MCFRSDLLQNPLFFFLFGLKKKGMKTFLGLKETTWCGREEINHWGGWAAGHTECIGQV
jgi:hypothetical protein